MSYIESRSITIPDFSGGVNYARKPHKIRDDQLSELCNMELRDGLLQKRSGYTTFLSNQGFGDVLAVKEWRGHLYFVCTNGMGRIGLSSRKMEVLCRNLQLTQRGSFLVKDGGLYYFSGNGIYYIGGQPGTAQPEEQDILETDTVCELAPGIYTDGSTVGDFNSYTLKSYSLGEAFTPDFDFLCRYGMTLYGVKKQSHLSGVTSVTVMTLEKREDGSYVRTSMETKTAEMPLHSYYQYVGYSGIYIRRVTAVKEYLLFQCDYISQTSSASGLKNGYIPLVMRYRFDTASFETDCSIREYICELGGVWEDTVYILRETDEKSTVLYIHDLKNGTSQSVDMGDTYISNGSSSSYDKEYLTQLVPVGKDLLCLTQRMGEDFQTRLLRISGTTCIQLGAVERGVHDLVQMGESFYELPVFRSFDSYIGREAKEWRITPYFFGNDRLEWGDTVYLKQEASFSLSPFCRYGGKVCRLLTSHTGAVRLSGYVPLVLEVLWSETNQQYETVAKEQYNRMSPFARVRFIDEVSTSTCELTLPISYEEISLVRTTGEGRVKLSDEEGLLKVTKTEKFRLGEELLLCFKSADMTAERCHLAVAYGGINYTAETGTRLFAAGDAAHPNTYFVSGVNQFDYFPELNHQLLEDGGQKITGFAKHYENLILFKDRSISLISYDGAATGATVRRLHDTIGCDMPGSIQVVHNDVVFGNSEKGIFLLSVERLTSERNLHLLSVNISGNRGIDRFDAPVKRRAVSLDFKNRYYLAVGDRIYIWDYGAAPYRGDGEKLSWFEYRGIGAGCLFSMGECFGFSTGGSAKLSLFDGNPDDDGEPVEAFFTTKAFDFGNAVRKKHIRSLSMEGDASQNTRIFLSCITEQGMGASLQLPFLKKDLAGSFRQRRKEKRVHYCGFRISHKEPHCSFSAGQLHIEYSVL